MNNNFLIKIAIFFFIILNVKNVNSQNSVNKELDRLSKLSRKYYRVPDSLLLYSHRLLELSTKHKLIHSEKTAYKSLGYAYSRLMNYEKSIFYYHKALSLAKKSNDERFKYIIYNDLSLNHRATKYYDSAFYYSRKLIAYHKLVKNKTSLNVDYMNLGITFFQKSSLDSAETYLLKSINGFRENDNKMFVSTNLSMLAEVYFQKDDFVKALSAVDSSQKISEKIKLKRNYARNYSLFSRIHNELGNVEKSEKYYKLAFSNKTNNEKNKGFSIDERLSKSRAKHSKDKIERLLNEKEFYKSNLFVIFFMILISLFFSFSLFRRNKKSKKEVLILQEKLNGYLAKDSEEEIHLIHLKSKAVIDANKLMYIKSDGHYVEFYIESKTKPEIDRNSLIEVLRMLPTTNFVRIHNSYIVNIKFIKIINSTKLMLNNGQWLNLSRTYKQQLKEILHKIN